MSFDGAQDERDLKEGVFTRIYERQHHLAYPLNSMTEAPVPWLEQTFQGKSADCDARSEAIAKSQCLDE